MSRITTTVLTPVLVAATDLAYAGDHIDDSRCHVAVRFADLNLSTTGHSAV